MKSADDGIPGRRPGAGERPRFAAYVEASRAVFAIFDDTAPTVEAVSIDEAFLDVRGLREISGSPLQIATGLRATVREEVGLPITVGIATTKLLAKVVHLRQARRADARRARGGDRLVEEHRTPFHVTVVAR